MRVIPFMHKDRDDLYANTFILIDSNNDCMIVDPSSTSDGVIDYINRNSLKPRAILLTHSHFDHMRGVDNLTNMFKIPLYVGFDDADGLTDITKNCSKYSKSHVIVETKPNLVADNEIIKGLEEDIKVIYTPYHTAGSVCFYLEKSKILFSGDSLFRYCIGRDDLPTSTPETLEVSLYKLKQLPNDVKVYPGHGLFTSIGEEKNGNRFLK